MTSPHIDTEQEFLRLGVQYYVAARHAAWAFLLPVCGNLFHHAIEMLMKARLSQTYTLEELKQPKLGHNLQSLWDIFKGNFPNAGLEQFDGTIATLHQFEDLRYPNSALKHGAEMHLLWSGGSITGRYDPRITPPRKFQVIVANIDLLVARIFAVSHRNPAFFACQLLQDSRETISRSNPAGDVWLVPTSEETGRASVMLYT